MDTSGHTNILVRTTYNNLSIHHHRKWEGIRTMVIGDMIQFEQKRIKDQKKALEEERKEIEKQQKEIEELLNGND